MTVNRPLSRPAREDPDATVSLRMRRRITRESRRRPKWKRRPHRIQVGPCRPRVRLLRWGVRLVLLLCVAVYAGLFLQILARFGLGNALMLTVLVAPPGLVGAWMTTELILRRTLDETQNRAATANAFRLGLLTAVILVVAAAQSHYQAPQGFGVLAATVGGALLWNTFTDIFYLWANHHRGPAKRPLQYLRSPPPVTRAHRFPHTPQRRHRVANRVNRAQPPRHNG